MYNEEMRAATIAKSRTDAATLFLAKVFNWMAIGLGLTGLTAFLMTQSQTAMSIVFGKPLVLYGLIFGELGLCCR